MNILTVYHGDECIDGWTSAWLSTVAAGQAGYKEPDLFPLTYENGQEQALIEHINTQPRYDAIYILDISLTLDGLETLVHSTPANIICLDHHKTAFDRYVPYAMGMKKEAERVIFNGSRANIVLHNKQVNIALNNDMSGAGMTYIYFFPNTSIPLLVQHVQDRDIWKFNMEHTKAVNLYLKEQKQTIENWTKINARMCHAAGYKEIVDYGYYLLKKHEAEVLDLVNNCSWPVTINKATGFMVRCGYKYASDVGHMLCKKSGTFGLTYFSKDNGMLQVSLRSEGNYDVEAMAKKLGGGGHKNAAGFIISEEKFFSGELA
jgi:oligoribonuclease NrnB/cAMP/cGMP phosphodiesterase (DHH superfamily)